jgi:predicted transcriptional regulator
MVSLRHLKHTKVRDEMTKGIATVGIDAPLTDAIDVMARNDISAVVVIYPNGSGAGVISSYDILRVIKEKSMPEIKKMTTDDIMSDIITIEPDKTLDDALKLMIDENIHRVIVLSSSQAGSRPIGIISATDMVRKLLKVQNNI